MTRLPTLKPKQIITAFTRGGFIYHHQTGSHRFLWHEVKKRMTVVAIHPGDVPRPVLKQIIKQAGMSERLFRELI